VALRELQVVQERQGQVALRELQVHLV
jgi:hypothetical protein